MLKYIINSYKRIINNTLSFLSVNLQKFLEHANNLRLSRYTRYINTQNKGPLDSNVLYLT